MTFDRTAWASRLPILLWALVCLGNLFFLSPVLQNGDSAVYVDQIARGNLAIRTTHIGYIFMGVLADHLIPLPLETAMNLLCLLHASLAALAMLGISRRYGAPPLLAAFSAIAAFSMPAFLRSATMSEVDTVQTAWILLSLWIYLSGRAFWAGPAFGVAMLVTPLSSLSLPLFLILSPPAQSGLAEAEKKGYLSAAQKAWIRRVGLFAASSLLLYIPVVWAVADNYFFGPRSITAAPRHPFDLTTQIGRGLTFYLANAISLLPFVLLMLTDLLFRPELRPHRRIVVALLVTSGLMVLAGERFDDVPVQLPLLCFALAWVPVWLHHTHARSWGMVHLLAFSLLLSLWLGYRSVTLQWDKADTFQTELRHLREHLGQPCISVGLHANWDNRSIFHRLMWQDTTINRMLTKQSFLSNSDSTRKEALSRQDPFCFFTSVNRKEIQSLLNKYDHRQVDLGTSKRWILVPKESKKPEPLPEPTEP